jgi:hypothetical protein
LIEEEYRLGLHSTHLEIATRAINDAESRISRQEALIARMEALGDDVTEANRMLHVFLDLRQLCERFHATILTALERGKL